MITLIRWLFAKQKEIKWKFAFWKFIDRQLRELLKNPEEIEKKIIPYLAELIHHSNQAMTKGESQNIKLENKKG